jgi:hypothetical protein
MVIGTDAHLEFRIRVELAVRIMRDGEEIQSMAAIAPGEKCYYIDNYAKEGYNNYSIIVNNEHGVGRESKSVEAYVGEDYPAKVENIKASVGDKGITLSWDPVTKGEHGGVMPNDPIIPIMPLSVLLLSICNLVVRRGAGQHQRVLIPINHCDNIVVGVPDQPIGQLVAAAVEKVKELIR